MGLYLLRSLSGSVVRLYVTPGVLVSWSRVGSEGVRLSGCARRGVVVVMVRHCGLWIGAARKHIRLKGVAIIKVVIWYCIDGQWSFTPMVLPLGPSFEVSDVRQSIDI